MSSLSLNPMGSAPPRRHRPDPRNGDDLSTIARTIPRGIDAADASTVPGVDPSVWADHVRYARTRDAAVLDRLVAEYERYARSLARRLRRSSDAADDLDQIAFEALVVALRRFDPERGLPFPAFATPTILGALRRHYRDHGWAVRVPRRVHEFAMAERAAVEELVAQRHRQPTAPELAEAMGMDLDALLAAQDALHARNARSLDARSGEDDGLLGDLVGGDDLRIHAVEDRVALAEAMASLDEPARELIRLYFFEERSQSDIAQQLGVSQMQVSRLLSAVLRRLRQRMGPR